MGAPSSRFVGCPYYNMRRRGKSTLRKICHTIQQLLRLPKRKTALIVETKELRRAQGAKIALLPAQKQEFCMQTRPNGRRLTVRGELALAVAVAINSFAVAATVYAGLGISPVSSFPYAVSLVFPFFDAGHLDVSVPGGAGAHAHAAAPAVRAVVSVQFCRRVCVRYAAGRLRRLAALPARRAAVAHFVLCAQLPGRCRWASRCPTAACCPSSPPTCSRGTLRRSCANRTRASK